MASAAKKTKAEPAPKKEAPAKETAKPPAADAPKAADAPRPRTPPKAESGETAGAAAQELLQGRGPEAGDPGLQGQLGRDLQEEEKALAAAAA